MTKRKTALIVDADLLVYSACTAVECEVEWSPGVWSMQSDAGEARGHLDSEIRGILSRLDFKVDRVVLALSNYDVPGFRKGWMPEYKANRLGTRKPLSFFPLRESLEADYEVRQKPGLEGDDVIGILMTDDRYLPGWRKIMASTDKDMLTIPGLLVNWGKGQYEPRMVTEEEAEYQHMLQTLTGDITDGYKGCPGTGPVRAKKLLADGLDWSKVVGAYEAAELCDVDALLNARMARILRAQDYDFEKQRPIPWMPREG